MHSLIVVHSSLTVTCIVIQTLNISDSNMRIADSSTCIADYNIYSTLLIVTRFADSNKYITDSKMCIADSDVHCDRNTVACRKHKGVVGWLCTKLEGFLGKPDSAVK